MHVFTSTLWHAAIFLKMHDKALSIERCLLVCIFITDAYKQRKLFHHWSIQLRNVCPQDEFRISIRRILILDQNFISVCKSGDVPSANRFEDLSVTLHQKKCHFYSLVKTKFQTPVTDWRPSKTIEPSSLESSLTWHLLMVQRINKIGSFTLNIYHDRSYRTIMFLPFSWHSNLPSGQVILRYYYMRSVPFCCVL